MEAKAGTQTIGYLWAVATVVAALTLQVLLSRWVQGAHVFLYFIPAVALTAWMGGTVAAVVATGLSTLSTAFILRESLLRGSLRDIEGLMLFAVACGAIVGVIEAQRKAVERDTALRIGEKVAQAAMAAAEKRDRTALDNTWDVAILILDTNRIIREWNVGASQITGWTKAEMMGMQCDKLYTESDVAAEEPRRQFVLAEAGGKQAISRNFRRKDGKEFHAEGMIRPILDQTGWVSGFLMVFIDNTSRVLAHEAIENQLKERAEELESLTYSMAHDMRQYSRGMVVNARMLIDDYKNHLGEEGLEMLERIQANAQRMHAMVEGILDHTKLSRSALNAKPVDLSKLASESASRVTNEYGAERVRFDIQPDLWVRGDATMLELLLNNLFENAAKYGGGTVQFGFDPEKDSYFVRDQGLGFKQEYADKIFRVFERLHGQDKPGTGIGLANAKAVVERHGGKMWALSEGEGKGATFYFSLKKFEEAPVGTLL